MSGLHPAVPRLLHPAAWWLWAIGLAYAAMRTANPILLILVAVVAGAVVSARRSPAPWANAYALLLKLALLTIGITMVLQLLIGVRVPGHVLFRLPSVPLPSWMAGLSLGGPVTGEAVLNSFTSGLRLAVLIACFGAANALAHPARLVRILPAALYEVGVAVVVAMTFVPHLAESVTRVRRAQRMRGRSIRGVRGLHGLLVPVLEEALERAISLAASMDSRGYGRRGTRSAAARRAGTTALLVGLGAAVFGTYRVIGASGTDRLGLALLVAGPVLALAAGLAGRGGTARRTRYRPDRWALAEWLVVGCAAVTVLTYALTVPGAAAAGVPLAWPHLPPAAFLATVVAALPAVLTPAVPAWTAAAVPA
ncbi:MAG: energy-coupling factor transporter transmembrane protein EcfT [Jatrophihabitans sp.]|nr:MAG: energy-coupling factor transporter transmembrane protein EcfT [Jatrophihabitans sp.]